MKTIKIPSLIYNQISSLHHFIEGIYNLLFSRDKSLVDQFFNNLTATYRKIDKDSRYAKQFPDIVHEVEELLKGPRSWREAYNIEQLLIALISDEHLEVEWQRKLGEAKSLLGSELNECYKNHETLSKRELLTRLVIDLQWHYETEQTQLYYKRVARRNTGLIFIFTFLLFFLSSYLGNLIQNFDSPELSLSQGTKNYHIFTAITAGALGAAFSILIGLKQRLKESSLEDLKTTSGMTFLTTRITIGIGAGLILFYLIDGKVLSVLLSDQIVPIFEYCFSKPNECNNGFFEYNKNIALLVIWCFIGGFSEKMVPDILAKTEERFKSGE